MPSRAYLPRQQALVGAVVPLREEGRRVEGDSPLTTEEQLRGPLRARPRADPHGGEARGREQLAGADKQARGGAYLRGAVGGQGQIRRAREAARERPYCFAVAEEEDAGGWGGGGGGGRGRGHAVW